MSQIEDELRRGAFVDPRRGRALFSDSAEEWLRAQLHWKESTRKRNTSLLRNHALPHLGKMPLASVKPETIRAWVLLLSETKAPATVVKAYQLVAAVFNAALEEGTIGRTPCRGVKLPRVEQNGLPTVKAEQLWEIADSVESRYRALVLTAAYTGLRWGELAALRVESVDFLRRRLTVTQTLSEVSGQLKLTDPKTTASRRVVALPQFLIDDLAVHVERFTDRSGFIFTGPHGGPLRRTNFRRRVWMPAVHAAGLEGLRFHDLRHVHATLLISAGAPVVVVQHRLGHSRPSITLDRYSHLFDGVDDTVAENLEEDRARILRALGPEAASAARGPRPESLAT
jgi:integrase